MKRITKTLMAAEIPDDLPHHLAGLAKIVTGVQYVDHPDETKYADASMALAELSAQVDDGPALKTVRDFMRSERNTLRQLADQQQKLIEGLESWLRWAAIWTVHKDDKREVQP